jgi:hypothetical protein
MPKRKADSEKLQGCVQPPPALRRSTPLTNLQSQVPTQAIHVASKDDRRTTSPSGTRDLLSLPKETRDRIWSEVLGDRTLHLRYTPAYITCSGGGGRPTIEKRTAAKWNHGICVADLSEQAIYQQSTQDEERVWRQDCDNHHNKCHYGPSYGGKDYKPPTLDLRLLRTNHQIHKEASAILLRTNLFSIDDEKCFVHFMQTLDPARKAMLAKLHLSFTWQTTVDGLFEAPRPDPDLNPWNRRMPATLIAQLSGLHTLHICMAQGFYDQKLLGKMKRMGLSWVAGLLRFGDHEAGAPALKTVTVSLTDEEWDRSLKDVSWTKQEKIEKKWRWTLREKQEFAEKVRQRILNN